MTQEEKDKVTKESVEYAKQHGMTAETKEVVGKMVMDMLAKRDKDDEEARLAVMRKTAAVDDDPVRAGSGMNSLIYKRSANPQILEMQQKADELYLLSQITKQSPSKTRLWGEFRGCQSELSKAMAAGASGSGAEWIPTGFSADLIDRVRLELVVASIHDRIAMPTNPYKSPIVSSDSMGYLIPESVTEPESGTMITASDVGTRQVTFAAKKLAGRVVFSEELNEDSIIPILGMLRQNIITAMATAQERATISGDTTVPHMDSDVTGLRDARKAWTGYRKTALAAAKVDCAGVLTQANLRAIRKGLGKYGVSPSKLCWIVGVAGFNHLLALNAATNHADVFITPDKYGSGVLDRLNGEVGRIDGVPVIVTEHIREDLNATGVYDGGLIQTKTIVILANRPAFQYGDRRDVKMKTADDAQTDQTILVITQRVCFEAVPNPATEKIVGIGYNITA